MLVLLDVARGIECRLDTELGAAGLSSHHAGHLFATLLPARVLQLMREQKSPPAFWEKEAA